MFFSSLSETYPIGKIPTEGLQNMINIETMQSIINCPEVQSSFSKQELQRSNLVDFILSKLYICIKKKNLPFYFLHTSVFEIGVESTPDFFSSVVRTKIF